MQRAEVTTAQSKSAIQNPKSKIQNPRLALGWANRLMLAMPLAGLAFYDGTRKRRKILLALVLFSLGSFFWVSCAAAAPAPAS